MIGDLKKHNGYWIYEEGKKYLAELTSGKISDTFINTGVVTCRPTVLDDICEGMIKEVCDENPNYVCSPAVGGITLGYELAAQAFCAAIFTEPKYELMNRGEVEINAEPIIEKKGQSLKRFSIEDKSTVLFVEDVITTGKSTREMIEAVLSANNTINCVPIVICLVNRSGQDTITVDSKEFKIISKINVSARVWDTLEDAQKDCPNVIEALRPKQNWKKLTEGK